MDEKYQSPKDYLNCTTTFELKRKISRIQTALYANQIAQLVKEIEIERLKHEAVELEKQLSVLTKQDALMFSYGSMMVTPYNNRYDTYDKYK